MKKLYKISLGIVAFLLFTFAVIEPLNMAGNWYQQFLPNINGRTIVDIHFTDSLTGYIITTRLASSGDSSFILKTTNGGDNWTKNHFESFIFKKISFINQTTGYVGGTGLIKTTNGGVNWFGVNLLIACEDMKFINNDTGWYVFTEALTGGVFRTTNGGANWTQQINLGSQNPVEIYFYNGSTGYIAKNVGSSYVRKTTNGGENWSTLLTGEGFTDINFVNNLTGWKAFGTMKKTTDGGNNWVTQTLPSGGNILLTTMDKFINLGADTIWGIGGYYNTGLGARGMIYRTTNGGNNWQFQVPDSNINIFKYFHIQFINSRNGWAYNPATGVHTVLGGDPVWFTPVTQLSTEVPMKYALYQNYPNPFNPTTNIKYQIVKTSEVKLIIFDITGKEIGTLTDNVHSAGVYQVDWNASGYSSGIYFYKLTVSSGKEVYSETKRMVLIK